ncbi:MAG: TIGR04282 family arsenosugar biosynthesis glycosyltransferase, partial [Halanaerobiales bacterium]|nr:TIGR04282 family arsenosugar biosynthesis glycosyltransferase [Halanaerobiales bacterium]
MQAAVVLMSRAPRPGETKIRLESHLKKEECAELQQAFLKDINTNFLNLKRAYSRLDLYLSYTPTAASFQFAEVIDNQFVRIPQRGKNLGEKMYYAISDAYQQSNLPVIITGSELPLLDIDIFTEALAGLKERDLVIGPSQAGGYYLIGMKKPEKFLFDFENWGNSSVLEKTIREASRHNLKSHFLPEESEVDTFKKLLQLRSELRKREVDSNYPQNTNK